MKEGIPPRLHVVIARGVPCAVVLRRGPSHSVCTVGWNLRDDEFVVGQWLKGRIYERRCDISPDGKYFIYFALNARWESETKGAYTAISRSPYLKAIGLWANGNTYYGGGLFVDERSFWLNGSGDKALHVPDELVEVHPHSEQGKYGCECPGVYYPRLKRDGWTHLGSEVRGPNDHIDHFEKAFRSWTVRKLVHSTLSHPRGKGCYYDEHELVAAKGRVLPFHQWEWAEVDAERNRLVWAEDGKLFAAEVDDQSGPVNTRLLHDFNSMKSKPIAAPY